MILKALRALDAALLALDKPALLEIAPLLRLPLVDDDTFWPTVHHRRWKSTHMPAWAREESRVWLVEHGYPEAETNYERITAAT